MKRLVVLLTLGLDARQARDEHDGVRRDLLDDCVLVDSIQRIKEFASSWPLVASVILYAHDVDPIDSIDMYLISPSSSLL